MNLMRTLLKKLFSLEPQICSEPDRPGTNSGTSSSAGLLVIGGVTYSNSLSSNSKGSAAEPIPHTQGLLSEHLHKRSTIESTLASKSTLLARTTSSSCVRRTTSSLLASSSWQ